MGIWRLSRSRRERDLHQERGSGHRHFLARDKGEGATGQHRGSKMLHHGHGLEVQITEHDVGAPATNQLDDAGVDTAAEEGHGAASTR